MAQYKKIVIILGLIFLIGCSHAPCKDTPPPKLELEYSFMECGKKAIEHEGVVTEHKVWCLTNEDYERLNLWLIFWGE